MEIDTAGGGVNSTPTGATTMTETPEEWLEDLFEFEYCAECGGDAEDHEVCIVPGMGTYFAHCNRAVCEAVSDDEPHNEGVRV